MHRARPRILPMPYQCVTHACLLGNAPANGAIQPFTRGEDRKPPFGLGSINITHIVMRHTVEHRSSKSKAAKLRLASPPRVENLREQPETRVSAEHIIVMSVREEFTGAMAHRSPSIGRSVTRTRRFQTRGPQRQLRKMCPFRNFASNHILAASHSLKLDEAQGAEPRKRAPPF